MVLCLVCTIITLGIKIVLKNKLASYEAGAASTVVQAETAEQFIVATVGEETDESDEDLIRKYDMHFKEIDALYGRMTERGQDEGMKDDYRKISELWDRELKALSDDISSRMNEDEKKAFFDAENNFLVSRNHECMKAVGHNKVSFMEEIDYLDRYTRLTREHCNDLVKDYSSYLAS
ncbi:Protein of unknown function (DUF1311) [Lachnospiraceae bacterium JC7]|nr:Protein of unknown function (DUF1311) [Lachnospiraceae bacterium JC7]